MTQWACSLSQANVEHSILNQASHLKFNLQLDGKNIPTIFEEEQKYLDLTDIKQLFKLQNQEPAFEKFISLCKNYPLVVLCVRGILAIVNGWTGGWAAR